MDVASKELTADIIYQIGALKALSHVTGNSVQYVKPHGALYNTIAVDRRQADSVIEAILLVDPSLKLMALAGSPMIQWATEAGLSVISEAFADRAYTPEGNLLPRTEAGAVLHDPLIVAKRMVLFAKHGMIQAVDGSWVKIEAQSICVHGDSPGAVMMARIIREHISKNNIQIRSFCDQNFTPSSFVAR
jgi:UPF0271 protein